MDDRQNRRTVPLVWSVPLDMGKEKGAHGDWITSFARVVRMTIRALSDLFVPQGRPPVRRATFRIVPRPRIIADEEPDKAL